MTESAVEGIRIEERGNRVIIDVSGGRWEGSAAEAERLLTRMHYVLARARAGTNIVSMFVNGQLWGGKTIETDPDRALDDVGQILDQLSARILELAEQGNPPTLPTNRGARRNGAALRQQRLTLVRPEAAARV